MESAGPGKACTFSGFDYRGFKSLSHTYSLTHSNTHTYTNKQTEIQTHTKTETQIHTPSPETKAGLNYRPPDRTYLLKNGGLFAKDSFCC